MVGHLIFFNKNFFSKRLFLNKKLFHIVYVFLFISCYLKNSNAMEFRYAANGGNCYSCNWIVAEGEINERSHLDFEKFIAGSNLEGKTILLNSNGGNVFAAIQLGIKFRELKLYTKVARSFYPPRCDNDNADCHSASYYEEIGKGKCLSACAYAFLGGVGREVASENQFTGHPDSVIGFHQFYNSGSKMDRINKIIEEETLFSEEQLFSAILLKYITDMGVDANVLALSGLAGPSQMYYPNAEERKRLKIDYILDDSFKEIDLEAYKGGLIGFSTPNYVVDDQYYNKIKQLTFYCREKGRLSLLFTSDLHTLTLKNSKDRRLERYIFDLELNTKNKNDTDYKENIIDKKRLSERNDDANHYLSVELNNSETLKIMDSKEISLEINGPRVMGYYTAYLPLNHNVKETLTLIMKNCF
jgi:hypothetical protein